MPDSQQPPFWGPAYHERDLDALLSGAAGNTPPALRPVESTLAALRAAPTRRELSDEAAARAAFRATARPQEPWPAAVEHGTVTQHTLVLPAADSLLRPGDRRRPSAARRRRRRRAFWGGRRAAAIALTSVAAVAVIVIAVAITGAIPGSIGKMMSFGSHPTKAASSAVPTGRTPGSLDGSATASHPTPTAPAAGTPSVSPSATTGSSTLCRELFEPSAQQNRTTWLSLVTQVSQLAGGQNKVFGYCFRYLSPLSGGDGQRTYPIPPVGGYPGGPGDRGSGYPGVGESSVRNPGAGIPGVGNSGAGNPMPGTGARIGIGTGTGQRRRGFGGFGGFGGEP
jgi:hypothetical protein